MPSKMQGLAPAWFNSEGKSRQGEKAAQCKECRPCFPTPLPRYLISGLARIELGNARLCVPRMSEMF